MRDAVRFEFLAAVLLLTGCGKHAPHGDETVTFERIGQVVESVRRASFPQLQTADIHIFHLRSDSDFLQARFTVTSFFARKLQYMIFFNPEAFRRQAPSEGLRAIVAHELAHIAYYENQSRMGMLSLIGLLVPSFTTRYERKADLDAIALGYGRGLEVYRVWLYRNIPAGRIKEKKRDYYTPEEIEALLQATAKYHGNKTRYKRSVPKIQNEIASFAERRAAV